MKKILSTIAIFLLILSGCNIQKINSPVEEQILLDVRFCPGQNCLEFFLEKIDNAQTVECALYDLAHPKLIEKFESISDRLTLIVDKRNYEDELATLDPIIAKPVQYMHNKFCIFDQKAVITGSLNPTVNGFEFNNNNLIYIESNTIVKNFQEEFDELKKGIYGKGAPSLQTTASAGETNVSNYFCPDDGCQIKVLQELRTAEHAIYFMTFSFTDEDIADVLITKDLDNIDVKGIIERRNKNTQGSQYQRMKDFGIDVILDKNKKSMHHKVFVIDNATVITGSYNPTRSGNLRNDENILIIRNQEIAKRFAEEFHSLFFQ